jgi:hypothetical protein
LIEDILPRLEKVKRTGRNNWLACCPAHEDRSPSMTLHAADDGRILVKCFAGCGFLEIKDAVGLGWDVWFPPKRDDDDDFRPPIKRPFPPADVLEAVAFECSVVAVSAEWMASGEELAKEDRQRLLICYERIAEARRLALG